MTTRNATKSAASESPAGQPRAHGDEPDEDGERADEVAAEVERVGEQRRARERRAARSETTVREMSIAITTRTAANTHQAVDVSISIQPTSRATASAADGEADEHEARRLGQRGEVLGLAVAVRVRAVGAA